MKKTSVFAVIILLLFSVSAAAQSQRSLVLMYPLSDTKGTPWAEVKADSIAWSVRCTYEIDPQLKENHVFRNTSLINLMCEDIRAGRVAGFGTETDSFTSILNRDGAFAVTDKAMANDCISCRIRVTEDIVGMRGAGQQHHCIIGIAPEMKDSSGSYNPLFWIYFAEIKPHLASTAVSNKNADTWLNTFDRRDYSIHVTSSTDTIRYPNIVHHPHQYKK